MNLRSLSLVLALFTAGCSNGAESVPFDLGQDFSIPPQVTHVGKSATTCCMVTRGAEFALYLADPVPGQTDARGNPHPPNGELHLTNAFTDYTLASNVAAYSYGFTPDGRWAMYAQKSREHYSLNFASVEGPDFKQPTIVQVVPDGIQDQPITQQGFFSPTARYFIVGVLPSKVANTPDLHVIDLEKLTDVFNLPNGSFAYFEQIAPDDTMVFNNSTASTTPGTPSQDGLYVGNLSALIQGLRPSRIDTFVTTVQLVGDQFTVLYVKANGDLMLYELRDKFQVKLASNVISISAGPQKRGPYAYIATDRSLHVIQKLGTEIWSLPSGAADPNGPIVFSPDGRRIYWFKMASTQDQNGELWTALLPPGDGKPVRVAGRVSTGDLQFLNDKLLQVRNVDGYGAAGDMTSSLLDGSNPFVIASGVGLGGIRSANPIPPAPPPTVTNFGPFDLGAYVPPPVFANLTGAKIDPNKQNVPINQSNTVLGQLAFGTSLDAPEIILNPSVHAGQYEFSDDGYILAYAGDAVWNDTVSNYVGTLQFYGSLPDTSAAAPALDGVSELGPIRNRAMFVDAPANSKTPGVYFIKF